MPLRILLIRFGSFGDVVLTTPTLINLKIRFPDSHITFLTKERFRSLVTLFDGVDEVLTLPENVSGVSYAFKLIASDTSYDLIIDLHGNPRSWLTRTLTYSPRKLVYPKRRLERRRIVSTKTYPTQTTHTIDLYNAVIKEVDGYAYCQRPVLPVTELPPVKETEGFGGANGYICIAPEASHPPKTYPLERFVEAAVSLYNRFGVGIVWLVTKEWQGSGMAEGIPSSHQLVCKNLDWPSLASVIANARMTIANDSGIAHLSSAVGTPVAAIFGPTHPSLGFAPRGQFDIVIDTPVWCRPCSLHGKTPCFRDQQYCFTDIPASRVATEAVASLSKREKLSPALFIDRDGTLIEEKEFLKDSNQVVLIPGAAGALKQAKAKGFKLVVISNQSGVARGLMTIEDVEKVNARLLELLAAQGVMLDSVLYCPEYPNGTVPPYSRQSYRRKPAPGMIEEAVKELAIDPRRSCIIGDKLDDLNLARMTGSSGYLVCTGYGTASVTKIAASNDAFLKQVPVADTITEAIGSILSSSESDFSSLQ